MNKVDLITSEGTLKKDLDAKGFSTFLDIEIELFKGIDTRFNYIVNSFNNIKNMLNNYLQNSGYEAQLMQLIAQHNIKFQIMSENFIANKIIENLKSGNITDAVYLKLFENINYQLVDKIDIYLYYKIALEHEFSDDTYKEQITFFSKKYEELEEKMADSINLLTLATETFDESMEIEKEKIMINEDNRSDYFSNWMLENENKINNLESQYRKVLEFKAPAKFWKEKSEEYAKLKKKWWIGFIIMVFILIITTFVFGLILFGNGFVYETGVLTIEFIAIDKTISLGTMLFIVAIESIILYVIKVILSYVNLYVKLEEFYKAKSMLTSFYITMSDDIVKEKDIQSLIYQQLFSFSDVPINEINDRGILKEILSATSPK